MYYARSVPIYRLRNRWTGWQRSNCRADQQHRRSIHLTCGCCRSFDFFCGKCLECGSEEQSSLHHFDGIGYRNGGCAFLERSLTWVIRPTPFVGLFDNLSGRPMEGCCAGVSVSHLSATVSTNAFSRCACRSIRVRERIFPTKVMEHFLVEHDRIHGPACHRAAISGLMTARG